MQKTSHSRSSARGGSESSLLSWRMWIMIVLALAVAAIALSLLMQRNGALRTEIDEVEQANQALSGASQNAPGKKSAPSTVEVTGFFINQEITNARGESGSCTLLVLNSGVEALQNAGITPTQTVADSANVNHFMIPVDLDGDASALSASAVSLAYASFSETSSVAVTLEPLANPSEAVCAPLATLKNVK